MVRHKRTRSGLGNVVARRPAQCQPRPLGKHCRWTCTSRRGGGWRFWRRRNRWMTWWRACGLNLHAALAGKPTRTARDSHQRSVPHLFFLDKGGCRRRGNHGLSLKPDNTMPKLDANFSIAVHPRRHPSRGAGRRGHFPAQLARHLKTDTARINEICRRRRGISAKMAVMLGQALGTSAGLWMNLQKNWELSQVDPHRRTDQTFFECRHELSAVSSRSRTIGVESLGQQGWWSPYIAHHHRCKEPESTPRRATPGWF